MLHEIVFPLSLPSPDVAQPKALTIGWIEHALLTLGKCEGGMDHVEIKAKVDTGAKTSSLHAINIHPFYRDMIPYLRFTVPLEGNAREVEAPLMKKAVVKTSEGTREERFFVQARINMGAWEAPITLSLNDRSTMLYPVLLGRSFLSQRFVVDVSKKFLLRKPKCKLP